MNDPEDGQGSEIATDDSERLSVEDVVDHESNCAACGVHDRVEDSRYCADCRDALVRADGGSERRDPADDPRACSLCGTHIGFLGDDYCDGCAREIGVKPPLRRCVHCGQRGPEESMEAIDVSGEDEYYPKFEYLCRSCSGGESDGA